MNEIDNLLYGSEEENPEYDPLTEQLDRDEENLFMIDLGLADKSILTGQEESTENPSAKAIIAGNDTLSAIDALFGIPQGVIEMVTDTAINAAKDQGSFYENLKYNYNKRIGQKLRVRRDNKRLLYVTRTRYCF